MQQTPQYSKICKDLVKRGLLDIREATSVTQASYAEGWTATVQQHDKEPVAERYDYIVSATCGKATSCTTDSL